MSQSTSVGVEAMQAHGHGLARSVGAYVAGACFDRVGRRAAWALGDGTLRIAALEDASGEWKAVQAHDGAVLSLAPDAVPEGFVSGGDDGRFVRVDATGGVAELARFGGKWVEHTATSTDGKSGVLACAAGRDVHLFAADGAKLRALDHPSTVAGIAFDGRGKRVAVAHYNGASLWFTGSANAAPRRLAWKGSHVGVTLHPAAEAVVTAMQENALHGWRLPDGHDMRMSGYPSKPESLGFTRNGRWLASAGAEAVVLWPFFGGGPMGKPPLELAQRDCVCTRVACHPAADLVAAGYADGGVVVADIATQRVVPLARGENSPVTALAWSADGAWLAFGTEQGLCALLDVSGRSA